DAGAETRSESHDWRAFLLLRAAAAVRRQFRSRDDHVGGYPLGAILNASGTHWDVRGGVTDATPARARSVFSSTKTPAARNSSWVEASRRQRVFDSGPALRRGSTG